MFVSQAEAGAVLIQDFDFIARSVTEEKQRAAKGGDRHVLLNQHSAAVDTFTKIDGLTVKINLRYIDKHFHGANSRNKVASQTGERLAGNCSE